MENAVTVSKKEVTNANEILSILLILFSISFITPFDLRIYYYSEPISLYIICIIQQFVIIVNRYFFFFCKFGIINKI